MATFDTNILHTSIFQWSKDLVRLSLPFQQIEVSEYDCQALIALSNNDPQIIKSHYNTLFSDDFIADIETVLQMYSMGAHIRFDLCSLKIGNHPPKIQISKDFFDVLRRGNMRVASSLSLYMQAKQDSHLFIFPWHDILPWSEFRMFIRDRRLVGVSQYHHHAAYPEIEEHVTPIKAALKAFSRDLIDVLHMDSVVADVFVAQHDGRDFKTTLIELNPFLWRTDPCLYSWKSGGDFDGGFRYRKIRYNPYRNTSVLGKHSEPIGHFREDDYRRS